MTIRAIERPGIDPEVIAMDQWSQRLDGVFEGGGIKGIALVGAAAVVEQAGYEFVNLAGTVVGATIDILTRLGLYKGDAFLNWMRERLAAKGGPHFPRSSAARARR